MTYLIDIPNHVVGCLRRGKIHSSIRKSTKLFGKWDIGKVDTIDGIVWILKDDCGNGTALHNINIVQQTCKIEEKAWSEEKIGLGIV